MIEEERATVGETDVRWPDLLVERHGPVTVCTINRPARMNAVSRATSTQLAGFRRWFDDDPEQRVVVLTGAGDRAFCTGADVGIDLLDEDVSRRPDDVSTVLKEWTASLNKPWLCAVNGICAGGALHFLIGCDFAIAAESARFSDPHVSIGHVSGLETTGLTHRIPVGEVFRLALTGRYESMSAARAMAIGLVSEVVPADQLLARAIEIATSIARNSPAAVAATRAAIRSAIGAPLPEAYRGAWQLVTDHAGNHPDATEGPRAFAERRDPVWKPL